MNIYVSNLNFRTRGESLQTLFGEYGEVSSANIITDRETGRSRGFGFVEMPDESAARNAINALNGFEPTSGLSTSMRPVRRPSAATGVVTAPIRAAVTGATGIDSDRPERAGRSVERPSPLFDKAVLFPAGMGAEVSGGTLDGRPVGWTGVGARTETSAGAYRSVVAGCRRNFWPGCLAETVNYAYLCP